MNNNFKIGLIIIGVICILLIGRFLWIFFENPYPRLHLIGTEYVAHSDELLNLNNQQKETYFLTKKYKYSKNFLLLGYGGGGSKINDYYGLGIADSSKKDILPPVYEAIFTIQDYQTNNVYIQCKPYLKTGQEPDEFYKIENNKLIPYKIKQSI